MEKPCNVPSLVALGLLCVIWTTVEAQDSMWPRMSRGSPSQQAPLVFPPPAQPPYTQRFHGRPPQEPQVPYFQVVPAPAVPQTPKQHSFAKSCVVTENLRIPCGRSDISAAGCEAINCCFDGQQCYFGKAVTVLCTMDAQFIVVVSRDVTLPNIDLESISLLEQGQGCTHVDSNLNFAIYHFPVTACGSVVMEKSGVIIYENRMSSSYEIGIGSRGTITRDTTFEFLFQCRYTGTSVETVIIDVTPLNESPLPVAALGPITVRLLLANGKCNTKACNEADVAYSSFYTVADYPVAKVLRDPVYVEVHLQGKTDPSLILTLGRCWTTTSPNPHSLPKWEILIDGCPFQGDHYLSSLVQIGPSSGLDFPTHHKRFIFKMFTFVDQNTMETMKEQVYIHCSTSVCTPAPGHNCEPSCSRKKRDAETEYKKTSESNVVASAGPVIMTSPAQ